MPSIFQHLYAISGRFTKHEIESEKHVTWTKHTPFPKSICQLGFLAQANVRCAGVVLEDSRGSRG